MDANGYWLSKMIITSFFIGCRVTHLRFSDQCPRKSIKLGRQIPET